MEKLTDNHYWNEIYKNTSFSIVPKKDHIRALLENNIPRMDGNCLEIGCFPGGYLAVLGEMGYVLNGIDLVPATSVELPVWLRKNGFITDEFLVQDFISYNFSQKYNIVCSFGFVEHFVNWEDVFFKHMDLVKENGYLVVTVPNFRGCVQRFLHVWLDKENYRRHHIPSMNLKKWEKIIRAKGFSIIYSGYFGKFDFWVEKQKRSIFKKVVLRVIMYLMKILRRCPFNSSLYSPYIGIIVKNSK